MAEQPHLEQRSDSPNDTAAGSREVTTADPQESIEKPAELMRLAHMVQSTLSEVREMNLDEAGRQRLSDTYNRTVTELRDLVSEDLQEELDEVAVTPLTGEPSSGELRIAHAQLVGWLQGLFQGIQASMASRATSSQQQGGARPGAVGGGGQYL